MHRPLLRRTRVNVKQSKNGCFTCKARRLKCDESKPTCLRCTRSQRLCEGYPVVPPESSSQGRKSPAENDESVDEVRLPLSVTRALSLNPVTDGHQFHWSRLGIEILSHHGYGAPSVVGESVWNCLLPQLNLMSNTVNAAMSAFGAAYHFMFLRQGHHWDRTLALELAQKALRSLRTDIASQHHQAIPLFFASVVLAATETMLRHFNNALIHLDGVFSVIRSLLSQPQHLAVINHFGLYSVAQSLDLQAASFILSSPPHLPSALTSEIFDTVPPEFDIEHINTHLIPLLHGCYHFLGHTSRYQGLPTSSLSPHLSLMQTRYLAIINRWLDLLKTSLSTLSPGPSSTPNRHQILTQQTQLLTVKIYISAFLSPTETAYDAHASSFQQILSACTELLVFKPSASPSLLLDPRNPAAATHPMPSTASPTDQFRLLPGLAPALMLTAMKYRHPIHRRRAIDLLGLTATEGPWDPHVLITVARRAVTLEESGNLPSASALSQPLSEPTTMTSSQLVSQPNHLSTPVSRVLDGDGGRAEETVPEQHRLKGCGMRSRSGHQRATVPTEGTVLRGGKAERVLFIEYWYEQLDHWSVWADVVGEW